MLNHTTTAHTASESGVILYVFPQTAWITEDYIIDQNLKIYVARECGVRERHT